MVKEKRKALFNWSGGKDSALALLRAIESQEYDIVALLTTVNRDSQLSTMHNIPTSLLHKQAASIGIPLQVVNLTPKGTMGDYESAMERVVREFKAEEVDHFIFGDIFLHDVRSYREKQLRPYGVEVVEPLWDLTTDEAIEQFLDSGLKTVVVTTMANLLGGEYIGRVIDREFIDSLPKGVDPCGENGEYHSFCYDGPLFDHPVAHNLGAPLHSTHSIQMEDGSVESFSYWFATLEE